MSSSSSSSSSAPSAFVRLRSAEKAVFVLERSVAQTSGLIRTMLAGGACGVAAAFFFSLSPSPPHLALSTPFGPAFALPPCRARRRQQGH